MPAKVPIHPWEKTTAPWMRIDIDFPGPFLGKMFLIVYDSYSKWTDAILITNITSSEVIDRLRCTVSIHGIPYFIVSDNGPWLASQEFNTFCKLNGTKNLTIAPYHPSYNSAAERSVQMFKTSLKKIIEGKEVKYYSATFFINLSYHPTLPNTYITSWIIIYQETEHSLKLCKTHINRYYC